MILNQERSPKNSLYYVGAVILKHLKENDGELELEEILKLIKNEGINSTFIYYALDWLFLISKIELINGRIRRI